MREGPVPRGSGRGAIAALAVLAAACSAGGSAVRRRSEVGSPPPPPAARGAHTVVVRAARLLDVREGILLEGRSVVVREGRIAEVSEAGATPEGACVIDLGDVTLLPGLIDAHTHLLHRVEPAEALEEEELVLETATLDDAHRALRGASYARSMLEAGFTTVRDLGNAGRGGDVALRDAIRRGWVEGPRMLVSTRAIAGRRGQFGRITPLAEPLVEHEYAVVDGPEEARAAVRRAIAEGADGIKLIVGSETAITLSVDEVRAAVDEAHRRGLWVAAHATDDGAAAIAVEGGVDSIEHGYSLSDETLRRMAEAGVALVPTDYPLGFYADAVAAVPGLDDAQREAARAGTERFVAGSRERLARALAAGVRVVAGSDGYVEWGGRPRGEVARAIFRAYVEAGMEPLEAIRSATIHGATLLGLEGQVGEIVAGAAADLVAVRGDPTADVAALDDVVLVMHGGRVAVSPPGSPACVE